MADEHSVFAVHVARAYGVYITLQSEELANYRASVNPSAVYADIGFNLDGRLFTVGFEELVRLLAGREDERLE